MLVETWYLVLSGMFEKAIFHKYATLQALTVLRESVQMSPPVDLSHSPGSCSKAHRVAWKSLVVILEQPV